MVEPFWFLDCLPQRPKEKENIFTPEEKILALEYLFVAISVMATKTHFCSFFFLGDQKWFCGSLKLQD